MRQLINRPLHLNHLPLQLKHFDLPLFLALRKRPQLSLCSLIFLQQFLHPLLEQYNLLIKFSNLLLIIVERGVVIPLLQEMLHIIFELIIHFQQFFHSFVQFLVLFFEESHFIVRYRVR